MSGQQAMKHGEVVGQRNEGGGGEGGVLGRKREAKGLARSEAIFGGRLFCQRGLTH